TWDFGDGSPKVEVQSDGNVVPLAKDGYARTVHRYEKAGHYLVRVERTDRRGFTAVGPLPARGGEDRWGHPSRKTPPQGSPHDHPVAAASPRPVPPGGSGPCGRHAGGRLPRRRGFSSPGGFGQGSRCLQHGGVEEVLSQRRNDRPGESAGGVADDGDVSAPG